MILFSGKLISFPEECVCSPGNKLFSRKNEPFLNGNYKEPECLLSFQNRNRMKLISPDPFLIGNASEIIGSELR